MSNPQNPTPEKTAGREQNNTDFTYVRKKRRGKAHFSSEEESGELNIVPYLDILINLIMFLLIAQATLVSLGMINVNASAYASAGNNADNKPSNASLRLTIGIAGNGFYVAAKGGVLPGQTEETGDVSKQGITSKEPTVPRLKNGEYDFITLNTKLRAIKDAFPETDSVYIAADDTVPYEVIVKTLDFSREDRSRNNAKKPLFPNVAFSQIN